jgi:murein DD-endopeptidase MepM/ murein hydrolase activator NlpD
MARKATTYSQAYGDAKAASNTFDIPEIGEVFKDSAGSVYSLGTGGRLNRLSASPEEWASQGYKMSRSAAVDAKMSGFSEGILGRSFADLPTYRNLSIIGEGVKALGEADKLTFVDVGSEQFKNILGQTVGQTFVQPTQGIQETTLQPGDVGYERVEVPNIDQAALAPGGALNPWTGPQTTGTTASGNDELIFVQKGPNKLQMTRSAAQAQGLSEIAAPLVYVKDPKTGLELQMTQQAAQGKLDEGWTQIEAPSTPDAMQAAPDPEDQVGLQQTVTQQAAQLKNEVLANKEYVNAVFKAYHGREAYTQELAEFTGKGVQDVYNVIKGGAPGGVARGEAGLGAPGEDISAEDITVGPSPAPEITAISDSDIVNDFSSLANQWLDGLEKDRFEMENKLQRLVQQELREAEERRAEFEEKITTAADINLEEYYFKKLDEYEWNESLEELKQIELEMADITESMNLGITQVGEMGGPMSSGTRRQRQVEERGMILLTGLEARSKAIQGKMQEVERVINNGVALYQDYIANQLNQYGYLLELEENKIIRLDREEKEYIDSQRSILEQKSQQIEINKQFIIGLLTDEETSYFASKAGITLEDSPEQAAMKMQSYYSKVAEEEAAPTSLLGPTSFTGLGAGAVSGFGSPLWEHGLDYVLAGGKGAPLKTPVGGTVTAVVGGYSNPSAGPLPTAQAKKQNQGFGNQVKIRLDDGSEVWFSHLDSIGDVDGRQLRVGDVITAGQVIGSQGNTGMTMGKKSTHLDITMLDGNGNFIPPREIYNMLTGKATAPTTATVEEEGEEVEEGIEETALEEELTDEEIAEIVGEEKTGFFEKAKSWVLGLFD